MRAVKKATDFMHADPVAAWAEFCRSVLSLSLPLSMTMRRRTYTMRRQNQEGNEHSSQQEDFRTIFRLHVEGPDERPSRLDQGRRLLQATRYPRRRIRSQLHQVSSIILRLSSRADLRGNSEFIQWGILPDLVDPDANQLLVVRPLALLSLALRLSDLYRLRFKKRLSSERDLSPVQKSTLLSLESLLPSDRIVVAYSEISIEGIEIVLE